jgi:hypothetical protein
MQPKFLWVVPGVMQQPKISDMTNVMDWTDRWFLICTFVVLGFAAWEVWQQYERINELHRTHPDKWPKIPEIPPGVNLYPKSEQRINPTAQGSGKIFLRQ